jgi:hypothetical protein
MTSTATISSRIFFDDSDDKNHWVVDYEYSVSDDSYAVANPFLLETYCQKGERISDNLDIARFIRVLTKVDLPNYTDNTSDIKNYSGYYQFRASSFTSNFYSADSAVAAYESTKSALKSLTNVYAETPIEVLKVVPLNLGTSTYRARSQESIDAYPGDIIAFYCSGGTGEYQFGYDIDKFDLVPGSITKLRVLENQQDTVLTINVASGSFTKELTVKVVLPSGYSNTIVTETVG